MPVRGVRIVVLVMLLAAASASFAADQFRIEPVSASEFGEILEARRGRVVLVNFWATWCRSCLEEIPALVGLADRFRNQGFELVAVSLDDPDSLQAVVLPFMEKWFPAFSSHISTERDMDAMVSVVDHAWNEILPTSYLIDRNGTVVTRIQGRKTAAEFEAMIQPLLD